MSDEPLIQKKPYCGTHGETQPAEPQGDAPQSDWSARELAERMANAAEFAGTCPSVQMMEHLITEVVTRAEQRATQAAFEAAAHYVEDQWVADDEKDLQRAFAEGIRALASAGIIETVPSSATISSGMAFDLAGKRPSSQGEVAADASPVPVRPLSDNSGQFPYAKLEALAQTWHNHPAQRKNWDAADEIYEDCAKDLDAAIAELRAGEK